MDARAARLRRLAAAGGLLASAVLLATFVVLDLPFEYPRDARERLEELARDRGRALALAVVFGLTQITLLPAILGIVHVTRRRSFRLAHAGGLLAVLGVAGHLVFTGSALATLELAERAGSEEAVRLYEEMTQSPALLPFLALGLAGSLFGLLALAGALWRSRAAPAPVAAALGGGVALEFLFSGVAPIVGVVGGFLVAAALASLGVQLARMSDAEWVAAPADRPPSVE